MKRKNIFKSIAVFALLSGSLQAVADDAIIVYNPEGNPVTQTPVADVAKITFDANGMNIVTPAGSLAIPYSEIQSIKFGETTGASTIVSDKSGLKVTYDDSKLQISGRKSPIEVAVFDINGRTVFYLASCDSDVIDLSRLNGGTYLAKVGNSVVKFIKH